MQTDAPRLVAFVVAEDVVALDLVGPLEAFSVARRAHGQKYELHVVSLHGGQVVTRSGLPLVTQPLSALDRLPIDTVIVCGGDLPVEPEVAHWLRAQAGQARRICSVCTGALVLAAAGLLDGRHATTHWRSLDRLAEARPQVIVERGPIYVRDGAVWTSAGVTAGIDLALALIEDDLGHKAAMEVARTLVMFLKRPGDQAQFSAPLVAQVHADKRFSTLLAWIAGHLDADLSVEALAARAAMAPRTFARRFVAQTGRTPAKLVDQMRADAAKRALEDGALPLKEIARRTGLGDEQGLRRALRRWSAATPSGYRDRFRTALSERI
jgi:transcriptional regulator GlxA family with amidase domain